MLFVLWLACAAAALVPDLGSSDYYKVLGVAKSATKAQVKAAYRKLALEWHPDKNTAPEASENFRKVAEAYEVLSDKEARARYDAGGTGGGFDGFDFHQFFKNRGGKMRSAADTFKDFFGDDAFANFDKFFDDVTTTTTTTSSSSGSRGSDAGASERSGSAAAKRASARAGSRGSSAFSSSFGGGGGGTSGSSFGASFGSSFGGMAGGSSSFSFSMSDGRTGKTMSSQTTTDRSAALRLKQRCVSSVAI